MSTPQLQTTSNMKVTPGLNISVEPQSEDSTPTLWTPDEKRSVAFARAALAFKDELEYVRSARSQHDIQKPSPTLKDMKQATAWVEECPETPTTQDPSNMTERYNRRIRILRAIQHGLTSVVSIIIAVLQSLTYAKYQQTKDVPGAWPHHPALAPTLLLMVVAIMALMFDICALIGYLMPGKRIADKAFRLAIRLHYWITGIKSLAYVVAASVCRAGFSMGGNKDLWGWSCSVRGEKMDSVNNAKINCAGNTVAWLLSLINIAIEVIGVIIDLYVMRRDNKGYQAVSPNSDTVNNPNSTTTNSASDPLLVRNSALDTLGDDVHGQLGKLTPDTNA